MTVKYLTVGALRRYLEGVPDSEIVNVHVGWDFPVIDDDDDHPQVDEDGFTMFLDYEDSATMVSKQWAEKHYDCLGREGLSE